jgi:hypothetical protein
MLAFNICINNYDHDSFSSFSKLNGIAMWLTQCGVCKYALTNQLAKFWCWDPNLWDVDSMPYAIVRALDA